MQFVSKPMAELDSFVTLRSRRAFKLLHGLDESKATGPDRLRAYILKKLVFELTIPLTMLCRRVLQEGVC
ncbi:hypothetical protein, partial [Escherichia coli]|uniref:hypothetical protein n=1 Tax=Escherichia coli TaxID=562 RepID=UPI001AA0C17F